MDAEVLIAGAGPVGLVLAYELARREIRCRVVDRAAGPAENSRALVVHCRTQELMEAAGLRDRIAARAIPVHGMRFSRGRIDLACIPFDLGPYTAISLPQQETEATLRSALAEKGVQVEWGAELTSISQDADGATASVGGQSIIAAYVVGCDGAHSATRHVLGIPFEGDALPETVWMADAAFEWDIDPDYARQFLHPDGALSVIPMPGGRWRLAAMALPIADDPSREFFEAALSRRSGRAPARMTIGWMSAFRVNCRLAASYRKDRVFLAGDAAHIHSPIGGQGMNVGMQDAFSLGARLAAALQGGDAGVLAGYEMERRPAAAAVIRGNARITRLAMAKGRVPRFLRDHLMPRFLSLPPVSRRAGLAASGLLLPRPAAIA